MPFSWLSNNGYSLFTDEEEEEEESSISSAEQEQGQEQSNLTNDESQLTECPKPDELEKTLRTKKEDGRKLKKNLSNSRHHVINCQGKNLRIHIPLTNPTRTVSAITYLLWDDLVNQSSKKHCGPTEGRKLHINKTKLHHAEKMIKGAFVELYKGLGYLKIYR